MLILPILISISVVTIFLYHLIKWIFINIDDLVD